MSLAEVEPAEEQAFLLFGRLMPTLTPEQRDQVLLDLVAGEYAIAIEDLRAALLKPDRLPS